LAQPHIALPQDEPLFDLVNVPPAAFKKIFKTTRNIIQTTISTTITTPEVLMKDDVWAYPQATVEIKANSAGQFEEIFNKNNNKILYNKNYASEMRGLWRLEKDFMGGPYISLAELDASNQRVVVAFGYVYAPSKDKRNLLQQVEAMVYTLKLNEQDKKR